jgi:beta-lactamase superfamily II metal-dependent hydrolase
LFLGIPGAQGIGSIHLFDHIGLTMLGIHVFDVGQGDSILLELPNDSWGVVDCKSESPARDPSLLRFLRNRSVQRLAFVCLTHPHEDHFSGLPQILETYGENIDEVWCFRIDSRHRRKFLEVRYNAATTRSRTRQFEQLRVFFEFLQRKEKDNQVCLLDANHRLSSFGEVEIDCLAPHPRELSNYQTSLARWAEHPEQYRANENQLSAVLRLKYGRSTVLLGSDATSDSWIDIARACAKRGDSLLSNLVKVSHHGSTEGFFRGAWEKISQPQVTNGAISAGAQYGHPHREVTTALRELGVRLHCTNYAPSCLKTDEPDFSKFQGLSQPAQLQLIMLDQSPNAKQRTCDGDLHFQLDLSGDISFAHQYQGLCPFHLPID